MFDCNKRIRRNIAALKPYSSARDEYSDSAKVFLDANENSLGSATSETHCRYPDPYQNKLKNVLSEIKNVSAENIFVGNGSDEAIDLIVRVFCEPGKDSIVICPPTYGMYQVVADINDVAVEKVLLRPDFTLNIPAITKSLTDNTKLVFICSPNNPTGNAISKRDIFELCAVCEKNGTALVVDEAYVDFCPEQSVLSELSKHSNLIVLQTLSKAWGLAELRVGLAFASKDIVSVLSKVKPPYNVNGISQKIALEALSNVEKQAKMVEELIVQREKLRNSLLKLNIVQKIFPSDANFLLIKVDNAKSIYEKLKEAQVIIRDRSNVELCEGCLRITVGSAAENNILLTILSGSSELPSAVESVKNSSEESGEQRTAKVVRKTSETEIQIEVNLDGTGKSNISTGIGFFDHMLSQIARHSGADLSITCKGDLEIDEHHSIEDTALALGEAFTKSLGDKRGIERYGFLLPMDESLAQVAIDFSGRPWLEWNADFKREKIGEMPTEMFKHFFKSFCDTARCNLNIKAEGDNEHHKIESIFKAFARSVGQACKKSATNNIIPSTKGVL